MKAELFYIASKVLWLLFQPTTFLLLAISAGIVATRLGWKRGISIVTWAFVTLIVVGTTPVSQLVILPLEQRFAGVAGPEDGADIAGIVLLGGFEESWISYARPGIALNDSGERLAETVRLAHRFPKARVIFTGGDVALLPSDTIEGPLELYFTQSGVDKSRLRFEIKSRTTYENAQFLRELLRPQPGQTYLLVTSAFHMPRSVGAFRKAGFEVWPYPVDYQTPGTGRVLLGFMPFEAGLRTFALGVKEWLGLVAYRLSGRTGELWPSP